MLDPLQEQLMRNPVVGLFMTEAAIASEIVRSIPLDDRNRDYLKELRDEIVDIKQGIEEKENDPHAVGNSQPQCGSGET